VGAALIHGGQTDGLTWRSHQALLATKNEHA